MNQSFNHMLSYLCLSTDEAAKLLDVEVDEVNKWRRGGIATPHILYALGRYDEIICKHVASIVKRALNSSKHAIAVPVIMNDAMVRAIAARANLKLRGMKSITIYQL